jgi:tetratricopeptide (TPR) repeat protein
MVFRQYKGWTEKMMTIDEILKRIDDLFDENKAKEAELFMLEQLEEARKENDKGMVLQILNELIGYYRQTSEIDNLKAVIEESLALATEMGLSGTVSYATTALNAANGYRAMGDKESSLYYYKITEEIYNASLSPDDMLLAGLFNNISLLYQELLDYETAENYLLKALDIVKANAAGFEIAVTYANLANTCILGGNYEKAEAYGKTAVECFKARNLYDAHYSSALSALGMCYYQKKEYAKAKELFLEGMNIVENTLGRNRQYDRLKANYEACQKAMENHKEETTKLKGMDICRMYYTQVVAPMIHEKFSEYETKIAAGLVGEGSDCFGYDDEISRDHDWGPDVCLWVTEETYNQIGESLADEYDKLPDEFMDFKRIKTKNGRERRGVVIIERFYEKLVGSPVYENINWQEVYDYGLAAAVNGQVFRDDEGLFSAYREKLLKGYPENIHFLKLAQDAGKVSQTGQYNYFRMFKRGDKITADRMLSDCIEQAMILQHHICGKYPPHDKWLVRSTLELSQGRELMNILQGIHGYINSGEADLEKVKNLTDSLGAFFARELYAGNFISDIESYIDVHTDELCQKAGYALLSDEELVDAIVKLEFEAFDKVKNEGGRAYCQNDWPTFYVMRKSQYLTWNRNMLLQYIYDFKREYEIGHNLITEKYGRMMESTAPLEYEKIKDNFPYLSENKKQIIEQIVGIQMKMMEEFAEVHPKIAGEARNLHTYEDNIIDTSYETYLRGEISTYSDKMLQLYGAYVVNAAKNGINIARETITNTSRLYGFKSLDEMEKKY